MTEANPTVRRRQLGVELRKLREGVGLTCEDVGERMEWSRAKVSRLENGKAVIRTPDLELMCRIYGAEGDTVQALIALSKEAKTPGWWHDYDDAIPSWFSAYVGLEAAAATIRYFENEVIPGLFQTPDYIRAIHRAASVREDPDEIDRMIAFRLARQQILGRPDAPLIWAVIGEGALRRVVGGPEQMRAQLDRLVDLAEGPQVRIQVLPFKAGAHASMNGPFTLLGFAEHGNPDVVYIENQVGALYVEKPAGIERYTTMFEHLVAKAPSHEESAAMISAIAKELR